MRPIYTPTQDEIDRVRQFIDKNTGCQYKGMRRKDYAPRMYPQGITSFARVIGLTRATVSKALNGHPVARRTWQQIVSEVNVYEKEDELKKELAKIRGISLAELERRLNTAA